MVGKEAENKKLLPAWLGKNEDGASKHPSPKDIDINRPNQATLLSTPPKTPTQSDSEPDKEKREKIRVARKVMNDHFSW